MLYPPVLAGLGRFGGGTGGTRNNGAGRKHDGSEKQIEMWCCETEIGTFWIRFDPPTRTRFLLGIGHEPLGWYYSPEAAADDVFLQQTGWLSWDSLASVSKPKDLSAWTRMDCQA